MSAWRRGSQDLKVERDVNVISVITPLASQRHTDDRDARTARWLCPRICPPQRRPVVFNRVTERHSNALSLTYLAYLILLPRKDGETEDNHFYS